LQDNFPFYPSEEIEIQRLFGCRHFGLGRGINMNEIDMPIQWQEGSGETVKIGFFES